MKKYFKKWAVRIVTAYAKRVFDKAVKLADSRHALTGDMYYIISDPRNSSKLIVLTTRQFLDLRHRLGIPSKVLPIARLKNQCWYHTPNKENKDALRQVDVYIRRLAFVRERIMKAKLS